MTRTNKENVDSQPKTPNKKATAATTPGGKKGANTLPAKRKKADQHKAADKTDPKKRTSQAASKETVATDVPENNPAPQPPKSKGPANKRAAERSRQVAQAGEDMAATQDAIAARIAALEGAVRSLQSLSAAHGVGQRNLRLKSLHAK